MSRKRAKSESVVAFEVHMFATSERIVSFRYPFSTTKPGPDWKPGPDEVQIAPCCFAVLGNGPAFQWPYEHSESAAESISSFIPGSVVLQAEWRDDEHETRPRILDGSSVSVAVERASKPPARERAPKAPTAPEPVPQPQQKSLFE